MLVEVMVDTETWSTREADPDSRWDRASTTGRITDVTARKGPTEGGGYYTDHLTKELDVVPGDTVYAVIAGYESGDTFGREGGHACVHDVFATLEEAEGLMRALEAYQGSRGKIRPLAEYNGKLYYIPWDGFFESLEELDIWSLTVCQ